MISRSYISFSLFHLLLFSFYFLVYILDISASEQKYLLLRKHARVSSSDDSNSLNLYFRDRKGRDLENREQKRGKI